jgi:hypothetical protein
MITDEKILTLAAIQFVKKNNMAYRSTRLLVQRVFMAARSSYTPRIKLSINSAPKNTKLSLLTS